MMEIKNLLSRDLRALFQRRPVVDSVFPSQASEGLEIEYRDLIIHELARKSINKDCVDVRVRNVGIGPSGADVFVGMIRLERWHPPTAVRLLVGLPLLEARVQRSVRETWLADYSYFGGLWVHTSKQLQSQEDLGDLRPMMHRLLEVVDRGGIGALHTADGAR